MKRTPPASLFWHFARHVTELSVLCIIWCMAVVVLYFHDRGFIQNTAILCSLSVLLGMLYARRYLRLYRPIAALKERESASPKDKRLPEKSGVREVDEVLLELGKLRQSVSENLELIEIGLGSIVPETGIFKIDHSRKSVYASKLVQCILGLRPTGVDEDDYRAFLGRYWELVSRSESVGGEENICVFESGGEKKYLKFVMTPIHCGEAVIGALSDYTELLTEKRACEQEKSYDPLTGFYTRDAFLKKSAQKIREGEKEPHAMVYIDIGGVRAVNQAYGHDWGDRYIKKAAEHIKDVFPAGSIFSRIYGDEILVFYQYDPKEKRNLDPLPGEILKANILLPDGKEKAIEMTAGFALFPEDSDHTGELVEFSSSALLKAKAQRGGFLRFKREDYKESLHFIKKRQSFDVFVEKNLLHYEFQPIVSAKSGEIFGFEGLMRPDSAEFSSPGEVLSVAQSWGKLGKVEELTCRNILSWIEKNEGKLEGRKIFFNTIPSEFVLEEKSPKLLELFQKHGSHTVMEITENEPSDAGLLEKKAEIVKAVSGKIAIDDYGTGYNNQNMLLLLSPNFVKIDRSLVTNIHYLRRKQLLVENIVSYCSKMGIQTIAEGVEKSAEAKELIRLGVDFLQGYFISPPRPGVGEIPQEIKNSIREMAKA